MKKITFILLVALCPLFFFSCKKATMEEDAKKAAELSNISNLRAIESDFGGAEKYYKDAQEIIDKYRGTEQFQEFFTLYNGFFEAGALQQAQQYIGDEPVDEEMEQNTF